MRLDSIIEQYASDELFTQLAQASTLPRPAVVAFSQVALPALVRQLAVPTSAGEAAARGALCRQLFLSRLLTDHAELLRTDGGWPDRRRYLTQDILGAPQVAALAGATPQPAQAVTLLGFLTMLALAAVGEQAHEADLAPAALGAWLRGQAAPAAPAKPRRPAPAPATGRGQKARTLSVLSTLALATLAGDYFFLGTPANATRQAAPAPAAVAEPLLVAAAPTMPAPTAPDSAAPAVAMVPAPPVAAVASVVAPAARVARPAALGAGLRDTVGNAGLARQIGGRFNVALGRYPRGEGQPLVVKLLNRATLTVGINSTESLLYKRLSKPDLPRPTDIVLDRLAFDLGQARLGAEGAQQLGSVASLLKTFPKARLVVVGHANNQEAQAIHLGLQRATVAVDELVKQGISASRLQAQGMLSTELPTDSDSPERQAMLQGISLKMSRL